MRHPTLFVLSGYRISNLMYWLQTTLLRCASEWCRQVMDIMANGARFHVLKGFLKTTKSVKAQWCSKPVVLWRNGAMLQHCVILWWRSGALRNSALCYVVKRKQSIMELCIALCGEEEAVHCETVHYTVLWRRSGVLRNCALCYVVKKKQCIVKWYIVLFCAGKLCIVCVCMVLC